MAASPTQPTTIVCVGVTGAGKSALCNCILNESCFKESSGFESHTSRAWHRDGKLGKVGCRVIDTVGFLDNRMTEDEKEKKFGEFADIASYGVDAFLLVMKYGRFTQEQENQFNLFKNQLGGVDPQNLLERTVLVFTHISPEKLDNHLRKAPQNLKDVLNQVQAIGVDSKAEAGKSRSAVEHAVKRIIHKNASSPRYSNTVLKEAESRREALQARSDNLSPDRKKILTKQIWRLNNGTCTYAEVLEDLENAESQEKEEQEERNRLLFEEEERRRKHETAKAELAREKEDADRKEKRRREEEDRKDKRMKFEHEVYLEKEKTKRQKEQHEFEKELELQRQQSEDNRQWWANASNFGGHIAEGLLRLATHKWR